MNTIKVISFDLDDTLWPCLPTIQHAESCLYDYLADKVPRITSLYSADELREKRRSLLAAHPELHHDLTKLRLLSFEQLADELSLTRDWVRPAFEVFYQARQQVTLFDDVAPVLDELSRDFTLVSLTNGNASTVETGVDHWFELALDAATVGKMKSEPDIYRQVLREMDIRPEQMVHIGDHPVQDISGAQAAGVYAIWLSRDQQSWPQQGYRPDAIIHTLRELPELLR